MCEIRPSKKKWDKDNSEWPRQGRQLIQESPDNVLHAAETTQSQAYTHTHKTKPEWKRMISRVLRSWEAVEEVAAARQKVENDRVRL